MRPSKKYQHDPALAPQICCQPSDNEDSAAASHIREEAKKILEQTLSLVPDGPYNLALCIRRATKGDDNKLEAIYSQLGFDPGWHNRMIEKFNSFKCKPSYVDSTGFLKENWRSRQAQNHI